MTAAKPIEHALPRVSTVKEMYATAFRCGHPLCKRPLYRMNDTTGDLTLNSTVAHIHARRQNGPRWSATMTEAENRSEANLILLCLEHSLEVDAIPDDYPAEDMRAWKLAVRAEYDKFHEKWDLSEDQVAGVFAASFQVRDFARTTVESESLTQCVRLGAMLIEQAAVVCRPAQALAVEWVALCNRYTRESNIWDDAGDIVRVSPPTVERTKFTDAMVAELKAAEIQLEPTVQSLVAELRALSAANTVLGRWCEWVEREARGVLKQCTTATLEAAPMANTEGLYGALDALSAKWRGEEAPTPPQAPEPAPIAEPDPAVARRTALTALTIRARPWLRVTTRDYDAQVYDDLVSGLAFAASVPRTVGNAGIGLERVTELAAAVARNANDAEFNQRINEATRVEPLAGAVVLLESLSAVASETKRMAAADQAAESAAERLADHSWSGTDTWEANLWYCRHLFAKTAQLLGTDYVRTTVSAALSSVTVGHLLLAIANWREVFATLDFGGAGRPEPYVRSLPEWLPGSDLDTAVRAGWADLSEDDLDSKDVERRLAAEFLRLRGTL